MVSKQSLAVALSELEQFTQPDQQLEQYATDPNIAADLLWQAHMAGHLQGTVIDLGAGTGILAIGAALLGANVIAVEKDEKAIEICKKNLTIFEGTESVNIIQGEIQNFSEHGDVVIMNPPFGTKERHADRVFLEKAVQLAPVIYTMHKTTTRKFVESFCTDHHLDIIWEENKDFPLKRSMDHHQKDREHIDVTLFCLQKR